MAPRTRVSPSWTTSSPDPGTAASFRSFRIDPYPVEAHGLSDHAPLILELDLELDIVEPRRVDGSTPTEGDLQ